ncbi:MAG TPA: MFS transporter [Solirubrobacterales bacterium]|nr:MFS transporter [Solirubrobacterales bacterium]
MRRHGQTQGTLPGRSAGLFAALRVENFRLYFTGQAISLIGTWMQSVALVWLVLEITGSGTMLGLVVAAQFLPVLLLGAYAGLMVDRLNKRRLLLATQTAMALLALLLGVLTVTHTVQLWMIFAIAALFGCVNSLDNPARQSFVMEMVGEGRVQNAVSLNSAMVNASRAVGPAMAGGLIATVGVGICFLINAGSFIAVLTALSLMHVSDLRPTEPVSRERGQLREGFRYVRATVGLLVPLLMMALIGTLAYEFQVVLPLLARVTLHGGAETYGFMTAAMAVGAIAGGLYVATRERTGLLPLTVAAAGFGVAIIAAALAPSLGVELAVLPIVGFASTSFLATGNSTLQLSSDPRLRGRVMALWSVTFLGSTPIGGPILGAVSQYIGPRFGLAVGGLACVLAAVLGAAVLSRVPFSERYAPQPEEAEPGRGGDQATTLAATSLPEL